jgi:hypothetical protein
MVERDVHLLRLHSVGDFYSAAYIRKWVQILQAVPKVRAWAYTRSWRLPELLTELKQLAMLTNMTLQFSCDVETGLPPVVEGVKVNFLQVEREVMPDRAGRITLVWRTRTKGRKPMNRLALPLAPVNAPALVCPNYQGTGASGGHKITCQQCQFCLQ